MAKDSYLVDEAEEILDVDGKRSVEYVRDKHGGDGSDDLHFPAG